MTASAPKQTTPTSVPLKRELNEQQDEQGTFVVVGALSHHDPSGLPLRESQGKRDLKVWINNPQILCNLNDPIKAK